MTRIEQSVIIPGITLVDNSDSYSPEIGNDKGISNAIQAAQHYLDKARFTPKGEIIPTTYEMLHKLGEIAGVDAVRTEDFLQEACKLRLIHHPDQNAEHADDFYALNQGLEVFTAIMYIDATTVRSEKIDSTSRLLNSAELLKHTLGENILARWIDLNGNRSVSIVSEGNPVIH